MPLNPQHIAALEEKKGARGGGGGALWAGGNRAGLACVLQSEPADTMGKVLRAGKLWAAVRHSGAPPPLPQQPQ